MTGVIGEIPVATLDFAGTPSDPHEFAVTLRLRACVTGDAAFWTGDEAGGAGGTSSENRRSPQPAAAAGPRETLR